MDQGLNLTNSLYLASSAGYEVTTPSRTAPSKAVPTASTEEDSLLPLSSRPALYRETLLRSGRRLDVATTTVDQIRDLVESIKSAIIANRDLASSELANRRLLTSAHSAAQDLVDHAKSDGENLFGTPRAGDLRARAAQSAYHSQQSNYRLANGIRDGANIATAIGQTKDALTGAAGILHEIERLASEYLTESELLAAVDSMDQRLARIKADLSKVRANEVTQIVTNLESGVQPSGLPFDLQV